jgi:hypothetical protein
MKKHGGVLAMMLSVAVGTMAAAQRRPETVEIAFVANAEGASVALVDVAARAIVGTIDVNPVGRDSHQALIS